MTKLEQVRRKREIYLGAYMAIVRGEVEASPEVESYIRNKFKEADRRWAQITGKGRRH